MEIWIRKDAMHSLKCTKVRFWMTGLQHFIQRLTFAFHKHYVDSAYTEQGSLDQAHQVKQWLIF